MLGYPAAELRVKLCLPRATRIDFRSSRPSSRHCFVDSHALELSRAAEELLNQAYAEKGEPTRRLSFGSDSLVLQRELPYQLSAVHDASKLLLLIRLEICNTSNTGRRNLQRAP